MIYALNGRKKMVWSFALLLAILGMHTVQAEDAIENKPTAISTDELVKPPAVNVPALEPATTAALPNGLITSNWADFFNVTRLQERTTAQGRRSFTQATFIRFPSKIYIAQVFETTERFGRDPNIDYLEINVGGPAFSDPHLGKLFGWVCREQTGTGISDIVSCGLQYNLSDHNEFADFRKKHKLTSFVQVFAAKNNDALGKQDIVHYYSFSIYKDLYVRGYNNWYHYPDGKNYVRALQDFILPVNRSFDVYVRHTYQNRSDVQYGIKGSEEAVGIRYNFSF